MSEQQPPIQPPAPSTRLPRIAAWLAGAAIILVVANFGLQLWNEAAQAEVNRRQAFINQTPSVGRIDNALIRLLALAAAEKHDDHITHLLAEAGVHYHLNPTKPAQPNPAVKPVKP